MTARLILWSLENRFLVLLAAVLLAAWGTWAITRAPLDALPALAQRIGQSFEDGAVDVGAGVHIAKTDDGAARFDAASGQGRETFQEAVAAIQSVGDGLCDRVIGMARQVTGPAQDERLGCDGCQNLGGDKLGLALGERPRLVEGDRHDAGGSFHERPALDQYSIAGCRRECRETRAAGDRAFGAHQPGAVLRGRRSR